MGVCDDGAEPGAGVMRGLGAGGHVQRAGCGKHAVGFCDDGAGLMRGLEGRAEALAGTFKSQGVANTLWLRVCFSVFAPIRKEVDGGIQLYGDWCKGA